MRVIKRVLHSEDIPEELHLEVAQYKLEKGLDEWAPLQVTVKASEARYNYTIGDKTPFIDIHDYDLMSRVQTKFTFMVDKDKSIKRFIEKGDFPKITQVIIEDII